jgi:hypothetical protein
MSTQAKRRVSAARRSNGRLDLCHARGNRFTTAQDARSSIVADALMRGPHPCEGIIDGDPLYERAFDALSKFGSAAREILPAILKMKTEDNECSDLIAFADEAIKKIKEFPNEALALP